MTIEFNGTCGGEFEAYYPVCARLGRLCPRLVPGPLWGLSLARIARMHPHSALAVCNGCDSVVELVHNYWVGIDRSGNCIVCGDSGNEIDEDWRYCISIGGEFEKSVEKISRALRENLNVKGIAYLAGLRLLCERCHLAKHLGYAMVTNRIKEAIEHLAKINNINSEEVKKHAKTAFHTHSILSEVADWTVRMGKLPNLDGKKAKLVESFLNKMINKGFFIYGGWLYYRYRYEKAVMEKAMEETVELMLESFRELSNPSMASLGDELVKKVKARLEHSSVKVLDGEFKLFISYVMEEHGRELLDAVKHSRIPAIPLKSETRHLVRSGALTGKWMVFTPTPLYPKIFRAIIEALERAGLSYHGKIIAKREDYENRKNLPIIIYTPSALSLGTIVDVALILRKILGKFYISTRLFFKPDVFTRKGMYSGTSKHKSYIYIY